MRTRKVKRCSSYYVTGGCPLYDAEDICQFNGKEIDIFHHTGEIPDWCPLRKGPVSVELVESKKKVGKDGEGR